MRVLVLINVLFLGSCSLIEKRRSDYSYLGAGVKKETVLEKSGDPIKRNIYDNNIELLTYGYCATPYWKEGIAGLLTFGLYNTTCKGSFVKMDLVFHNGTLVKLIDDTNQQERANANAAFARGLQGASSSMRQRPAQQTYQIPKRKSADCVSQTDHFGVTRTKCTEN